MEIEKSFSKYDSGTIGYPYAKEKKKAKLQNTFHISHYIQILLQNGS